MRVRIYDDSSAMLTLKSEREGIRRNEFEYPIPKHDVLQLLLLARGTIIEKTRHELPAYGVLWEIDVFKGDNEGLVLAEIELDFTDANLRKPPGSARSYRRSLMRQFEFVGITLSTLVIGAL